jgi:dGTPase
MGYYYAEREIMEDICTATGTKTPDGSYVRHPIVYIMEAADDIAYATADLADSVKKGRFTVRQFISFYEEEANRTIDSRLLKYIERFKDDEALYNKLVQYFKIHELMRARAGIEYQLKDSNELQELDAQRKALFETDEEKKILNRLEKIKNSAKYVYSQINSLKKAIYAGAAEMEAGSSAFRRALHHSDTPEEEFAIFENWLEELRLWMMYGAEFTFTRNYDAIMAGTFSGELTEGNNASDIIQILKDTMSHYVFDAHEIVSLELSAKRILESLLEDFVQAVLYADEPDEKKNMSTIDDRFIHMIPDNFKLDYLGAKKRIEARVAAGEQTRESADAEKLYLRLLMVTDFISGMTDSYARNLYRITNGLD